MGLFKLYHDYIEALLTITHLRNRLTLSTMIHRNMKSHDYIVIVKDIEKGYATFSQWDQLSTNMVFALPWRLLQQCPDGLILDKPETVEKLAEKEEALSDWDDDNRGVRWDENSGWTFKSLEKPDAPSTEEDTSEDFTPQPSLADSVEEEVLVYIATLHTCRKPYPHVCPLVLRKVPRCLSCKRNTRDRIDAFRSLREFTRSRFGNGTSTLRKELLVGHVEDTAARTSEFIKLDSFRLAHLWDERFDSRAGKYDMTGIKLLEEEPGQIVVRGPRSIAQEEY
ncbi:hypothetical protein J4E85_002060 [Alternaria conjuncta]|uniref:uncharacterized protein n=1 Tax=Alternaria conjuncta TaxID=181017 RepID=UPI0022202142|nr:uncharacterized protein J4E85_002060 [Alternaria conjuncta]KAI4934204.1 hypothetical protein J4E85_002060 [Alternaria conjuncta]